MAAKQSLVKGTVYALITFLSMAIMGVLTKMATAHGGEIWASFFLYLIGALVMIVLTMRKGFETIKTERFLTHFGRAAFGLSASFLYLLAMQKIPIVNATLLFNTSPLFIPILATLFFHIKVRKMTWLAIAIGFLGIIVIIHPTAKIFTQLGDIYGLASGIMLAVAYLLVKVMSSTEPIERILFYFFVLATITQLFLLPFAGALPAWQDIALASLSGLFFLVAQLCLVKAYHYATASQVGVYQYTSVVFVGIIDWLVWDFVPPPLDLLGVLLVIVAGFIVIRGNKDSDQPEKVNNSR